jgi:hypothetical protein
MNITKEKCEIYKSDGTLFIPDKESKIYKSDGTLFIPDEEFKIYKSDGTLFIPEKEFKIYKCDGNFYTIKTCNNKITYGDIYDLLNEKNVKCCKLLNGTNMICNNYNTIYYIQHRDDIIDIDDNDYLLEVLIDIDKLYMQTLILSIKNNGLKYSDIPDVFKNDREIKKIAVENRPNALIFMTSEDKIINDYELMKIGLNRYFTAFEYLEDEFKTLRIFKYAVELNGCAIEYAPKEIKKNRDLIVAAVRNTPRSLEFLTHEDKIINDYELIKIALNKNVAVFKHLGDEFKTLELFKYAVTINGCAIKYAPKEIKKNRDLIEAAVENNPLAINYVCKPLRTDIKIIEIYNNNSYKLRNHHPSKYGYISFL